jgi:type I restriction enzyme S subunit
MYTHYGISAEFSRSFVSDDLAEKLRVALPGDVVIVAAGETIEDIGNGTAWLGQTGVVIHDACFSLRSSLNPKYVSHFLRTSSFKQQIRSGISSGKISSINAKALGKAEMPIPCPDDSEKSLAIQGEIVRILDTFTELTAELTAELAARKKQYNYYRDQLLTFEEGEVEWMALGKLTHIKTGQSVNKNMIADNPGRYPVINSGRDPLGFLDDWNTEDDPIGITSRGAGVGSVTWQDGRYFRGNLNYSVTIKSEDDLDVHYLYHILEQFQPKIKELCTFDGIPALNAVNLKKLSIPVPRLSEQKRIAAILDKFDTLTTSLSEGLPREIALRQQQYEYYRDLLLSFPKPAEAVEA